MRISHPARTVIGVDIGRRSIKAAQLVRAEGGYRAFALALLPRPEPDKEVCRADALALRRILKRQGFSGKQIVVAAPEAQLLRAALDLPSKVAGAPMEQIVRMELSRLHNVPPDSFEMAHWELKTPDGSKPVTHTLAICCPHDAADAVLEAFERSGFDVGALDVRGAAAARACASLILPAMQITAIADLGWRSTSVLFACGRSLVYERSLDSAAIAELSDKLMDAFAVPFDAAQQIIKTVGLRTEAPTGSFDRETLDAIHRHVRSHCDKLLDELKVPLSYVNRQFPGEGVKRLLLIGGGAAIPELASYLAERLGIEVRMIAPRDLVDSPADMLAKAGNPAMTVAVGLARFEGV